MIAPDTLDAQLYFSDGKSHAGAHNDQKSPGIIGSDQGFTADKIHPKIAYKILLKYL